MSDRVWMQLVTVCLSIGSFAAPYVYDLGAPVSAFPGTNIARGRLRSMLVQGPYAYLGIEGGLIVLDLRDPSEPVQRRFIPTGGWVQGLALSGSLLYLADSASGVIVLDVSVPTAPREVGRRVQASGGARAIALSPGLAVSAHGWDCGVWNGLEILDVSDPTTPDPLGRCDLGGARNAFPSDLVVTNGFAYVAAFERGLLVVDLSVPANPRVVGEYPAADYATAVEVRSHTAFLMAGGIHVIDVSDPSKPTGIAYWRRHPSLIDWDVALDGDVAYFAGAHGLTRVDMRDPAHPLELGSSFTGPALGLQLAGTRMYVRSQDDTADWQFQVFDLTGSFPLRPLAGYDTSSQTLGVALRGKTAFVADGKSGLKILDVSSPQSPRLLASLKGSIERASGLQIDGNLAYVFDGARGGLHIVDVTSPTEPTLVGSKWIDGRYNACRIVDEVAYVAVGGFADGVYVNTLRSFDLKEGGAGPIVQLQQVALRGEATGMDSRNGTLYVASYPGEVAAFDIARRGIPARIGTYTLGADQWPSALRIAGDRLFLTGAGGPSQRHTLRVLDISNAGSMRALGSIELMGRGGVPASDAMANLVVIGDRAFVPDGNGGLVIVNAEDPLGLYIEATRGSTAATSSCVDVAVADDFLAVASYDQGLLFFENPLQRNGARIITPPAPVVVRQGRTASFTVGASGSIPLAFRWDRDGTVLVDGGRITGQGSPTLVLADVTEADSGAYSVVVGNAYGESRSAPAALAVVSSSLQIQIGLGQPGSGVALSFSTEVGVAYELQFSDDLLNWSRLDSVAGTGGVGQLTDNVATARSARFYRVRYW